MSFAQAPTQADLIKDSSEAAFVKDVIEASSTKPIIVDFWATWCGPCRQLTPALEKAVLAAKGAVKLVKIDIDKNPVIANQLRIQSVPTVYAFFGGRPVDGFQGAVPESQIKAFIDRLVATAGGAATPELESLDDLIGLAEESLKLGDAGGAAQAYAQILEVEPDNVKAIAGLARVYLMTGEVEQARQVIGLAPAGSKEPALLSVKTALELASSAPSDIAPFEARLKADPLDHEARIALAQGLAAHGHTGAAIDHLLFSLEKDREWNEQAARHALLKIFEAAGPLDPAVKSGRRKLSALLFS